MSTDDAVEDDYCCSMRRYFRMGIVGTYGETPVELVDFVSEWEPAMVVRAKYCPWCGKGLPPTAPVAIQHPEGES